LIKEYLYLLLKSKTNILKVVVAKPYKENEIIDLIHSFDITGDTFYAKRNTIKIFKIKDEEWNVKAFKVPHLINKFAYKYIRKSKAQRSFEYANYLINNDILTPKPIGYVLEYSLIGLGKSFYISENLQYNLTFRELIHDKNYPDREIILNQFAEFTFKLHEKGIHFLDHSPGNTLIVKRENKKYDFYLIDLNRMKFGTMNFETRIQNFANLTLTEDMINIISNKYAKLIHKEVQIVHHEITRVANLSAAKRLKKHKLKQKMGRK